MARWTTAEENKLYETVQAHTHGRRIDWCAAYRALNTRRTIGAVESRYHVVKRAKETAAFNALYAQVPEAWDLSESVNLLVFTTISERRWQRIRWKWLQRQMNGGPGYGIPALKTMVQLIKRRRFCAWWDGSTGYYMTPNSGYDGREAFTDEWAGPIKEEDLTSDEEDYGYDSDDSDDGIAGAVKPEPASDKEEDEEDVKPDLAAAVRYKRAPSADAFLRREAALRAAKREKGKGKEPARDASPSSPSRSPSPLPPPSTLLGWLHRPVPSTSSGAQAGPSGTSSSATTTTPSSAPASSDANPSSSDPIPSSDAPPSSSDTITTSPAPAPAASVGAEKGKGRAVSLSAVADEPSSSSSSSPSAAAPEASTPPSRRVLTERAHERWEKELALATAEEGSVDASAASEVEATVATPAADLAPSTGASNFTAATLHAQQSGLPSVTLASKTQPRGPGPSSISSSTTAPPPELTDLDPRRLAEMSYGEMMRIHMARVKYEAARDAASSSSALPSVPAAASSASTVTFSRPLPSSHPFAGAAAAPPSVGTSTFPSSSSTPRRSPPTTSIAVQTSPAPLLRLITTSTQTLPSPAGPSAARLRSLALRRQRLEKQRKVLQEALDVVWELVGEVTEEEVVGVAE
ncbi:hypothetical protein JCM6882_003729 [Rhodosporidiobolus microsporus]